VTPPEQPATTENESDYNSHQAGAAELKARFGCTRSWFGHVRLWFRRRLERGAGGRGRSTHYAVGCHPIPDDLHDGSRLGRGRHLQVLGQPPFQSLVLLQRSRSVPGPVQQLDQTASRLLILG
jgi:hypothetical protein